MAKKEQKVKVLKEGKFLRLVEKGGWEYAERMNCSGAVMILAVTPENKVLFVEQYRPPVHKRVIEFPAGLVGDGHQNKMIHKKESYKTAAKRELLEETGYKAKRISKILQGPVSSGSSSSMLLIVRAHNLEKVGSGGGDDNESIVVHEVPCNQVERWLKRMERQGKSIGPRIYAGLYFLNKYNKNQRRS